MDIDDIDYGALDEHIRDAVRVLRRHGFATTDSGDGISKPSDWYRPDERGVADALPFPHVFCSFIRETFFDEADRLARLVKHLDPAWTVEVTYTPLDGHCFAMVYGPPIDEDAEGRLESMEENATVAQGY